MRSKTVVIVENDRDSIHGVFCNDPNLEIDSGTIRRHKVPLGVAVEYVKPETMEECGCCGGWHRQSSMADCRDDDQRFVNCT